MGGRVPVRALVVVALLGAAAALAAAAAPGREDFERGRRLVEDNCGDCMGGTRQGLEDGVAALRRAFDTGYSEPAAVYRLLADAYATLAYAHAKTDPNALPRFGGSWPSVRATPTRTSPWPRSSKSAAGGPRRSSRWSRPWPPPAPAPSTSIAGASPRCAARRASAATPFAGAPCAARRSSSRSATVSCSGSPPTPGAGRSA